MITKPHLAQLFKHFLWGHCRASELNILHNKELTQSEVVQLTSGEKEGFIIASLYKDSKTENIFNLAQKDKATLEISETI